VWTPKRILILIAGLAIFLSGYGVYAYFLGGIDGLPPLPPEYCELGPPIAAPSGAPVNAIDTKLKQAFGEECEELKRMIKLDLRRKGWGLASDQFEPEKDGRIKLTPFSAFILTKRKGKDGWPEIHTVRCAEAYLTLDRQISNMAELGSRKIIKVELFGNSPGAEPKPIFLKNNRGTKEQNDDVEVLISQKPLIFEEEQHLIWSDGAVWLLDKQAGDQPTDIKADGMEIHLTKENQPSSPPKAKHKNNAEGASGVDFLVLRKNIIMHLWVDAQSGLFGSSPDKAKKKPQTTSESTPRPEKAHLIINTDGPFTFHPGRDTAVFDSPPGRHVQVMRENKVANRDADFDELECSILELKFRRKDDTPSKDDSTGNKEIETAHARARKDEIVKMDMVADKLHAEGTDMVYHGPTATMGAKTVISGGPLQASKEGHRIFAPQLTLINPDKNGAGQQALAKGPGRIDLFDKSKADKIKADQPDSLHYPWHAVWKDTLTSVKDKQGDKVYDLLTLTGDAMFIDDDHKQVLQGKRLQVWLEPTGPGEEKKDPADTKETIPGGGRQKPHKVDAFENVALNSPEMNITNAHHLVINFKDGVPDDAQLPAALPDQKESGAGNDSASPQTVTLPPTTPDPKTAALPGKAGSPGPPGARPQSTPSQERSFLGQRKGDKAGEAPAKNKEPMNLEAHEITAYVTRMGSQNFLREMIAEGTVHVHQKGATPKEKGIDIKGELLKLFHFVQGDDLHVWGDARRPAELHLGELTLIGPQVMISQKDNMAEVKGVGAMHMPAKNTMDGAKPAKEGSQLIIHWNKDMVFDGRHADFHGGVVAYQEESSLRCQALQVMLDRPVSFKEGQKGGQEAKVERMVCFLKVVVLEQKVDEKGALVACHVMEAPSADLDNPSEHTHASGPGRVRIWEQRGKDQDPKHAPEPKKKAATQAEKEMELTRIDFTGSMTSNNKKDVRTTIFIENVEVYNCPANRPDVEFDPNRPPKGAFYLRGDKVTNYTQTIDKDKKAQFMQAEGKVMFRTQEFFGHATTVKFNEIQDLVIFEGPPNNPARLFQFLEPGRQPREIRGTKILYNRRTGGIKVEGSPHIGD